MEPRISIMFFSISDDRKVPCRSLVRLGNAIGGDNTTRRISIAVDVDFAVDIKWNRVKAVRETWASMECMIWAVTNVEKDVKCAFWTNTTNISNLETILSVAHRERTTRFGQPQRVSVIAEETFRVHVLRGIAHRPRHVVG